LLLDAQPHGLAGHDAAEDLRRRGQAFPFALGQVVDRFEKSRAVRLWR
jgi:hypothetical protein